MNLPSSLKKLIDHFSELPSIGPRQATRLAFYLITQERGKLKDLALRMAEAQQIKVCSRCCFIHENPDDLCDICRDASRDQKTIIIIEKETDLLSLEKTGKYRGRYFIVGAMPKTGIIEESQKARIEALKKYIKETFGQADEVILGFNPSTVGDFHAALFAKEFKDLAKKTSRLGRGLPTGGEIEFADDETLGASLERRS